MDRCASTGITMSPRSPKYIAGVVTSNHYVPYNYLNYCNIRHNVSCNFEVRYKKEVYSIQIKLFSI
jgi:hypothetical protein